MYIIYLFLPYYSVAHILAMFSQSHLATPLKPKFLNPYHGSFLVSFRPYLKIFLRFTKNDALSTIEKRPATAVSDLDASLKQYLIFHADERVEFQVAVVEPHAGEFERSTVVKKENTFHDAGRLRIFQTKKFPVTGCGWLGKNGEK